MFDLDRNSFRGYAKVITDFPEADMQFEGIKAWILQGETHQLVFFQMEANARAYQSGGVVTIDTDIVLGTISGESWTSVDASPTYGGGSLASWTITPTWT